MFAVYVVWYPTPAMSCGVVCVYAAAVPGRARMIDGGGFAGTTISSSVVLSEATEAALSVAVEFWSVICFPKVMEAGEMEAERLVREKAAADSLLDVAQRLDTSFCA